MKKLVSPPIINQREWDISILHKPNIISSKFPFHLYMQMQFQKIHSDIKILKKLINFSMQLFCSSESIHTCERDVFMRINIYQPVQSKSKRWRENVLKHWSMHAAKGVMIPRIIWMGEVRRRGLKFHNPFESKGQRCTKSAVTHQESESYLTLSWESYCDTIIIRIHFTVMFPSILDEWAETMIR